MNIEKQAKDVMLNAITNYAKEYGVTDLDIQLMIKAGDEECTPIYQVLLNNKVKKQVFEKTSINLELEIKIIGKNK